MQIDVGFCMKLAELLAAAIRRSSEGLGQHPLDAVGRVVGVAPSLHLHDPSGLLAGPTRAAYGIALIETAPRPMRPITLSLDERRVNLSQLKRG
jgi:hypothetical protein